MPHLRALANLALIAILKLLDPTPCAAFSLSPMSVNLDPSGKGATRSFIVDNSGTEKLAIQISMAARRMDLDGAETNPDADDDFIVYPPQLVLGPNEKRTVRVTWAGDANPSSELAYRIIAEQLPVETEKSAKAKGAVIRMLLKYMGAVYVTPKDTKPDLVVAAAGPSRDRRKPGLEVVFENRGTAHALLKGLSVRVASTAGGAAVRLGEPELKNVVGQNILAKSKRRFVVPWPQKVPNGPVKVDFELGD